MSGRRAKWEKSQTKKKKKKIDETQKTHKTKKQKNRKFHAPFFFLSMIEKKKRGAESLKNTKGKIPPKNPPW